MLRHQAHRLLAPRGDRLCLQEQLVHYYLKNPENRKIRSEDKVVISYPELASLIINSVSDPYSFDPAGSRVLMTKS